MRGHLGGDLDLDIETLSIDDGETADITTMSRDELLRIIQYLRLSTPSEMFEEALRAAAKPPDDVGSPACRLRNRRKAKQNAEAGSSKRNHKQVLSPFASSAKDQGARGKRRSIISLNNFVPDGADNGFFPEAGAAERKGGAGDRSMGSITMHGSISAFGSDSPTQAQSPKPNGSGGGGGGGGSRSRRAESKDLDDTDEDESPAKPEKLDLSPRVSNLANLTAGAFSPDQNVRFDAVQAFRKVGACGGLVGALAGALGRRVSWVRGCAA